MNYTNREILQPLSERFVLGTMQRRSRRRFGRLFDENVRVRETVYEIEKMLQPLAWSLAPVTPSEVLWHRIVRQAGLGCGQPVDRSTNSGWRVFAAAASVAVLVASFGWWQASNRPADVIVNTVVEKITLEPAVGVFADAEGNAIWVARIYDDVGRADIAVSTEPEQRTANDYELWILRDDGIPVSLGLLPQSGNRSLTLDANAVDALGRGSTLAVSLEPLGGSPDVVPTGPVLYTAAMLVP